MKSTMLKKLISLVLTMILVISLGVNVFANQSETQVTVFIDGKQILFDVDPIIENGRTLVPMRYIFEALGAEVDWIPETQTAVAVKDDIKIEIAIGKNEMIKNGDVFLLDVPAKVIDGRTLVPVRAVSEGMEAKVDWDDELRKVIITSQNDITDVEKTEYSMTELSPKDTQILKDSAGDSRRVFEKKILPDKIIAYSSELMTAIESKSKEVFDVIYDVWDTCFASVVLDIQINSEYTYNFELMKELTREEIIQEYGNILKDLGMDSASNFEVSYDATPSGRTLLLLTFSNTKFDDPMLIVSKYIAVVPSDDVCRYFTGELSPINYDYFGHEVWMLCEITSKGRKIYDVIETTTKESFLNKIDDVINKSDL